MNPSNLKKDQKTSVRYSSQVREALADKGVTIQEALDWAIDHLLEIKVSVVSADHPESQSQSEQ